jgi:hypothetical protein
MTLDPSVRLTPLPLALDDGDAAAAKDGWSFVPNFNNWPAGLEPQSSRGPRPGR